MSSQHALFAGTVFAGGRPYAERAEDDARWHDRLALRMHDATWVRLRQALAGLAGPGGDLRGIPPLADRFEAGLADLDDDALRQRAAAMRHRLRREGFAPATVAECFAILRCGAQRTIGLRHFDTQVMAGYALLQGRLVEMATGEGKTFSATLPACTMALAGFPVHVITVNDYLAARDAAKMKPLYDFFGLTVGVVAQGQEKPLRRQAYAQAITYATNKEVAFDYLRDRVALQGRSSRLHQSLHRLGGQGPREDTVLRGLYFAIVDEADSVFVDEARTPLILSASGADAEEAAHCAAALDVARALEEGEHFHVSLTDHAVRLTVAGRARLDADAQDRTGPWTSVRGREELVGQALSAIHLYRRDQHYVVADGKVQIVDESTGRVMPDRSWERGLHQMIESKEGVALTARRETLARLTYQRLFRRYLHLSGMTGTAAEAAAEIRSVYGLHTARVPLHRASRRIVLPDTVVATRAAKWERVADVAQRLAAAGRPVLIGTRSVQASEEISAVLEARGLEHALLNAKQDVFEAEVVSAAGEAGRITVATNMAGRGTDIELTEAVRGLGGLHVVLTEFHESPRVDRQLVGRCARQGDPGSCESIVSLEDEVFDVHAPAAAGLLRRAVAAGTRVPPVAYDLLRRLAQWSAERRHASIRMQNLKLDRQLDRVLAFTGKSE
jgi:preprotein translocase subunit SecA